MKTISERMFDGSAAESELEDALCDAGAEFERMGWDYYDCSLELHDVPADYRLSPEAQKIIFDAGFRIAFVNHVDKWETHYTFDRNSFTPNAGWRVSYPHVRGKDEKGIWVEKHIPGWPQDWFETGYAVIVKATAPPQCPPPSG